MERLTMWYDGNHAICMEEDCTLDNCPFADAPCEHVQDVIDRLAAYEDICFDADGKERITVEELSALVKARDEGRVVVLAVDTNVFIVQDNHIYQFRVYDYSLVAKNDGNTRFLAVCEECDEIDDLDFWTDDIGKTVFLTRTEAEAAQKGGPHEAYPV